MLAFNSLNESLAEVPPADDGLPVGTLIFKFKSGKKTSKLNEDLPNELGRFAYYLEKKGDKLSKKIFEEWLKPNLIADGMDFVTVSSGVNKRYKLSNVHNLTEFRNVFSSKLLNVDGSFNTSGVYAFVGCYLFVAWHFLKGDATTATGKSNQILNKNVQEYISAKLKAWHWNGRGKLKPEYCKTTNSWFQNLFQVEGYSLQIMSNSINFRNGDAYDFTGSDSERNEMYIDLVIVFRNLLSDVFKKEFAALLNFFSPGLSEKVPLSKAIALGEGGGTKGFFNEDGEFGVSFFEYEHNPKSMDNKFYPKVSRTIKLSRDGYGGLPNIMITQWGINNLSSDINIEVYQESKKIGQLQFSSGIESFPLSMKNKYFVLDEKNGVLSFSRSASGEVSLVFNTRATEKTNDKGLVYLLDGEEIAFLILGISGASFYPPSTNDTPPDIVSEPKLKIDKLFLDNEFGVDPTFWNSPEQVTILTDLVMKLKQSSDFVLISSIVGKGIGRRIELFGPSEFNSDLISAESQSDNSVPNSQATFNEQLRYAYGEAIWFSGENGSPGQLHICTEGFVSPLRCTWSNWPTFSESVAGSSTTKAEAIFQDVGQYLWNRPKGTPGHDQGPPSYNVALSAFRAFGLFKSIIKRIELRVAEMVVDSALTNAEALSIVAKLEDYLINEAKCYLKQVGLEHETGVIIDHNMFQKYVD